MKNSFLKELKKRPLIFDGATGTMLQKLGLKPGGCPDELNLTNPEMIKQVHTSYVDAGSDVVTTATFGANRIKLKEYNLENKLREINLKSAKKASRASAVRYCCGVERIASAEANCPSGVGFMYMKNSGTIFLGGLEFVE